ncbi:MAG: serine hydrolase domain-containing protein [Erythrobacter sp.]
MKITAIAALTASLCAIFASQSAAYSYAELSDEGQIAPGIDGDDRSGALYEAGSIGKFACTLAVLRMVDRGALAIDARLGDILPETADTPIADVTLRQVLQSRSGIADGLLPAFGVDPQAVMQTPDAMTATMQYATGELANGPGDQWSYDLVNWIVVQALLEKVTGDDIANILETLVLRPAGMGQSRIFVGAIGPAAEPPASPGRPIPAFLTCAGGLATTPTDLIALARFAHNGGLSANSLAALTDIATPDEAYALGGRFIARSETDARLISWQTGSNGAYKSLVAYDPIRDVGFAAMTASGDATAIQSHRGDWMAEQAPKSR